MRLIFTLILLFSITTSYSQIDDCIVHKDLNDFYLIELDSGKVLSNGSLDSKVLSCIPNSQKELLYITSSNNELIIWDVKTSSIALKKEFPNFIAISKHFEKDNLIYLSSFDVKNHYLYKVNSSNLEIIEKVVLSDILGYENHYSILNFPSKDSVILMDALELETFTLTLNERKITLRKKHDDFISLVYDDKKNDKSIKCSTNDQSIENTIVGYQSSLDINDWSCSCNDESYDFEKGVTVEKEIKIDFNDKSITIPHSLYVVVLKNNNILSFGKYHYALYDINSSKPIWYLDLDF